ASPGLGCSMVFEPWEIRMKPRCILPFLCALFSAVPLFAQEQLPASTKAYLTTLSQLEALTQSDLAEISSKAQSGYKEAQYWLALVYEEGGLVPGDLISASNWMLKSAEQGYVPAQTGMGRFYLAERNATTASDYAEADRWFRLAALQGDAEA